MKKLTITIIILLAVAPVAIDRANGIDGWETNLAITAMSADSRLSFGQRADATDGIDGQYEVPAMLSGDIRAYFICNGSKVWRDIRGIGPNGKTWNLVIETSLTGKDIELQWNTDSLPEGSMLLDMKTGDSVDMHANSAYRYQHNETRNFTIEVMGGE
jgi:hypothetical protein